MTLMRLVACHPPIVPDIYTNPSEPCSSPLLQVTQEADYSWQVDRIITESNFLDFNFKPVTVDATAAGLFKVLFAPSAFEVGSYRSVCVCVCVRACVRVCVCVRACVRVCVI